MRLMIALICVVMLAPLLIIAIHEDDSPPRLAEVCIQEDVMIVPMFMMIGNQMTMIQQTHFHCVKRAVRCVWGADYAGPKVCSGLPGREP